jgi:four helix bundle protein
MGRFERLLNWYTYACRMKPFERLEAWRSAHELVLLTYSVTRSFPREELYGLTSQARRAAFSVAANIAEGSAKRGPREFRRYLDIAVGSLSELAYIFRLARDLGYVEEPKWTDLDAKRDRVGQLTWGLYRSIRRFAVK